MVTEMAQTASVDKTADGYTAVDSVADCMVNGYMADDGTAGDFSPIRLHSDCLPKLPVQQIDHRQIVHKLATYFPHAFKSRHND